MDWLRTLIIAALAVVSYLMIQQWREDYIEPQQKAQTESYAEANKPQQEQAQDSSASVPGESDIPSATAAAANGNPAKPSTASAQHIISDKLIEVDTDVLAVSIDPRGGDIVRVGLKKYPVSVNEKNIPIELLRHDNGHTYIAQSGLIGTDGPDADKAGRPLYSSAKSNYQLQGNTLNVDLSYHQNNGAVITKRFTFTKGLYDIKMSTRVNNEGATPWKGAFYAQIQRDGSPDPGVQKSGGFGLPTFLGMAYWDTDKHYNKLKFSEIAKDPLNKDIPGGWLAMIQHYFMSAWVPDQNSTYHYNTREVKGNYIIGFTSQAISVAPGQSHSFNAQFYAGPKIQKNLKAVVANKGLELAIDYGPLFFISKLLYWLLSFFHSHTGNWGVSIILLTFCVKLVFLYPSALSYRSMAKMRKVQPLLTRLKEQYGDDRQRMSQEMMSLYKKEKINPLGGCLPIVIQMPVFLALYWALLESVELRQAPFFGWIKDLSVMDPYFVLPLIMGGTMYVQQLLNPAPPDPMQAKLMRFMPIIFTGMFLFFPAGLVLYWVTNNSLSITQQYLITRSIEAGNKK